MACSIETYVFQPNDQLFSFSYLLLCSVLVYDYKYIYLGEIIKVEK